MPLFLMSGAASGADMNFTIAVAAHDGEGYQAALKVFNKAADRDLRIVEGLA